MNKSRYLFYRRVLVLALGAIEIFVGILKLTIWALIAMKLVGF